jgi:hypothetical protein
VNRSPWYAVLAGLLVVVWALPSAGQEKKVTTDGRLAAKITLAVENVTLEDLLGKLTKGRVLTFVVSGGKPADRAGLLAKRVVKLSVKDEPLGKVLDTVLKPLGATYEAKPDYIEISLARE